jgi:hypothetical protein
MPASGVWGDDLRLPARARPRAGRGRAAASTRPRRRGAAVVRWDRVGRVAMLFVLAALLYLYLSAGIHMLSKLSQARRDARAVAALEREHQRLAREHRVLGEQRTVELEARQLGMVRPGEQPYIASGLPRN